MRRSTTTLALAATLAASTASAQDSNLTCADGLYVIIARGTGEDPGTGATGILGERIADEIKGTEILGLVYPATFTDPFYTESVEEGGEAMKKAVTAYREQCPDGKIAIMGYSQGAQITGDAFCGDDSFDNGIEPLERSSYDEAVVAIVLFGDPTHKANETYDKGTSIKDGVFVREDQKGCLALGPTLISYCDTGDVYCDEGDDEDVHGDYIQRYGDDVVEFIVSRYEDATNGGGSNPGNDTATPTPSDGVTSTMTMPTESGTGGPTEVPGDGDGDSAASGVVPGFGLLSLGLAAAWALL